MIEISPSALPFKPNVFELSIMLAFFPKLCLDKVKHRWHILDGFRVLAFCLQITKSINHFVGLFTSVSCEWEPGRLMLWWE